MFYFDHYPTLTLHISNQCNQHCRFCFKGNDFFRDGNRVALKDIDRLIQRGIKKYRIEGIWFGGGEPFLCDCLPEAIQIGKQHGLKIIVTSNGVGSDNLPELRKTIGKIDIILLSLHSHIPAIHNRLVGNPNSFARMMEAISCLEKEKHPFIINCVCTSENYRTLPELCETVFRDFPHLTGLQILALKYAGRVLENPDIRIKMNMVTPYLNEINNLIRQKKLNIILRDFPLCLAPPETTASRYAHNYIGYLKNQKIIIDNTGIKDKIYTKTCKNCKLVLSCPGLDVNYARIEGADELAAL